ncbi:DUF4390 domain-containing protein [Castellaniella defragrans]|uniref:DUF4390 domain-containing protein n=2 Tax=Castellaniella defragrans TaxID=75697 RepID=A0A7W9WN41_CASDE|nr:DUF4390 domain-containing protein [Castellaniella defragrans]KAB0607792.1 DUF4390 domain-containing protein [Castellaniella defragrans]MBB6083361.1 hypothetical protein [Castellaniella defragrans]CDM23127.1 Probable proline rich signal peptide protein [Castellaniella defragrans 65Phen]
MPRFLILLASGLLFLAAAAARADDGQVVRIEPMLRQGQLLLDADIDFTLSDELHDAARKGVPLYFTVDLVIEHPRWWWFDETVLADSQTWRIQYNALTRQWRVGASDLSLPATSLDEALDLVRHIRDWPLGDASRFTPDQTYQGRLRLRLDTSRLARPFQVDALNSAAWTLTTPWKDFTFSISAATPRG